MAIRWKDHQRHAAHGAKQTLSSAIRKYGADSFSFSVLEEGWNDDIGKNVREPYWISVLKPEYNMTPGGDGTGSGILSAKYGIHHTTQTKEKISKARLGTKASTLTKTKMKAAHTGRVTKEKNPMWGLIGSTNPNFGSKRTLETRARMRAAHQQRKHEVPVEVN